MKEARNLLPVLALALALVMLKARMKVARNMQVLALALALALGLALVMLKARMKEARNMQVLALALALVMLKARMKVARNMQVLTLALALALVMLKASGDVGSIMTPSPFEQMLKHRNGAACKDKGFYSHNAFITAERSFLVFETTGDDATRKRELAAFFGQTSHETTRGWDNAPDGRYAWGYCFVREGSNTASFGYYGRGPIQLNHDYNYGQAGRAIGADLVRDPDLVAMGAVISFKTAIWFWMTAQGNKPSSHDMITNRWTPSVADTSAGRVLGYGVITNIINGGLECGKGRNDKVEDRIGFYKRYCDMMRVGYSNNLDCYNQRHFA